MAELPDLSRLSHDEKDALILALWAQVQALTAQVQILTARVAELEAKLGVPPKTPDNSSVPPSKGHTPNRAKKAKRSGPRQGSLGRTGGGRTLAASPDEVVTAKPVRCAHCQAVLGEADQMLHGRYDKIDLPNVAPVVTRVEHYAGHCPCCGGITLAPLPKGLEPGTPFSLNIVALAIMKVSSRFHPIQHGTPVATFARILVTSAPLIGSGSREVPTTRLDRVCLNISVWPGF